MPLLEAQTFTKTEKETWGFPQPTIIIDSQSTGPLRGKEVEQRFLRLYLMAGPQDLVITDWPINQAYWHYLANLHLALPKVIVVPNLQQETLSLNLLEEFEPGISAVDYLRYFIKEHGAKLQFFNLSPDELTLASKLGNPTYIASLEAAEKIGTKTGFRQFAEEFGVPVPPGIIAHSAAEVMDFLEESEDEEVIVKAWAGTGGEELGSNLTLNKNQLPDDLATYLKNHLSPGEPPYVVEVKLPRNEASLHFFLDENGGVISPPQIFGQITEHGSYVGGYYPFDQTNGPMKTAIEEAYQHIIPGLQQIGATGMHCFDYLFKDSQVAFIEDNTRPGALDIISNFVLRVLEANNLAGVPFAWFHKNTTLEVPATTFAKVQAVLGDLLNPHSELAKQWGEFVLISNPDVLSYGYSLHLTAVVTGEDASPKTAEGLYQYATNLLAERKADLML